ERGCLEHVRQRGLTCLQIFGTTSSRAVADPDFIGFCLDKRAEMGAKIVEKTQPLERVGVVTLGSDGAYRVVEYSEISPSAASRADPAFPDRLLLRGLATSHFLTADGLAKACQPEYETRMRYHAAVKRVPYCDPDTGSLIDSPPAENAIKLEKFVFDVFPFAGPKFVVWEVPRESEFSPLKNGPSASSECPNTCRRDLLALHSTWLSASDTFQAFLQQNSKTDASSTEVEVSPLLSYSGEDLANRSDWQEQQTGCSEDEEEKEISTEERLRIEQFRRVKARTKSAATRSRNRLVLLLQSDTDHEAIQQACDAATAAHEECVKLLDEFYDELLQQEATEEARDKLLDELDQVEQQFQDTMKCVTQFITAHQTATNLASTFFCVTSEEMMLSPVLRKFWEVEEIRPAQDQNWTADEQAAVEQAKSSLKLTNGRYQTIRPDHGDQVLELKAAHLHARRDSSIRDHLLAAAERRVRVAKVQLVGKASARPIARLRPLITKGGLRTE
uniref:UDP-N-acetylglucosamine diphosphorylase n=1 Tax=Macrostomum lignano TaxID=282301 RepID=A0A1I8IBN4_9PLAT